MTDHKSHNRLANEKSAYLQQHKENPVHWWSYGDEALKIASQQNKPIFLSIGYSSCHWCHVMAHESFEDSTIAKFLNQHFINIKVDREEMPDIDTYYQKSAVHFGGQGGWPLSAFLLPNTKPFFVGTYFPKIARQGMPSFMEVLQELVRVYNDQNDLACENAQKVYDHMLENLYPDTKIQEGFPPAANVLKALEQFQDNEHGGYGESPKFPMLPFYEWAVENIVEGMVPENYARHIVKSVDAMLFGGIHDQIRGGLHRYATDKAWLVPHFEKMLYDQSGFLKLLVKYSLINPSAWVFDGIYKTLEYLAKEMVSEQGYFFSAQDADSEGEEGLYFTFTLQELKDVIQNADHQEVKSAEEKLIKWFQMTETGNFERGLNVVSLNPNCLPEFNDEKSWEMVRAVRNGLLALRKTRIPPQTDAKGVASWNFAMISALCDCIQYLRIPEIRNKAMGLLQTALENCFPHFLYEGVVNKEIGEQTCIRHTTTKKASLAYFEDYFTLAECQLRLHELSGEITFLEKAIDLTHFLQREFVADEKIFTRAKCQNDAVTYPNLALESFDGSFKSTIASYYSFIRRLSLLDDEVRIDIRDKLTGLRDGIKKSVLANPLGCGEALRSLTYPDEAYRVIKAPAPWVEQEDFFTFIAMLPPRFVLTYHRDKNESWQVCSEKACVMQGDGVNSFIEALSPQQKAKE